MKEFVEYIAKQLVDSPEGVVVEEKLTEEKKVILSLKVQADEIGRASCRERVCSTV